jgi:hemerythrin
MALTWSKKMSVGNETIDSEHKMILDLVNEVDSVIKSKDCALYTRALNMLEEATRRHFKNEEKIAQAIHFPFFEHDLEHQYILGEFQTLKEKLAENQGRWSESVAEHYYMFLSTWAIDHVMEDDMKMKPLLETYPYDFMPDDMEG